MNSQTHPLSPSTNPNLILTPSSTLPTAASIIRWRKTSEQIKKRIEQRSSCSSSSSSAFSSEIRQRSCSVATDRWRQGWKHRQLDKWQIFGNKRRTIPEFVWITFHELVHGWAWNAPSHPMIGVGAFIYRDHDFLDYISWLWLHGLYWFKTLKKIAHQL